MTAVLLDTHVVYWLSARSDELSAAANAAITVAERLAVSSVTWYELAWLASRNRLSVSIPVRDWLEGIGESVQTIPTTPAIAATAVGLPTSFPNDPADRVIYATAIERGWQLVTKDRALRRHRHSRKITIW